MSTRGIAEINEEKHYIGSDAYPSFAKKTLKKAMTRLLKNVNYKYWDTQRRVEQFILFANSEAGFIWIEFEVFTEKLTPLFEEYRWIINVDRGTVREDTAQHQRHKQSVIRIAKALKFKKATGGLSI